MEYYSEYFNIAYAMFLFYVKIKIGDNMEIVDNKCPTCKASLEFNINTQNWKCKHCRNEYNLEDIKNLRHKTKSKVNELICPTCNAKLLTNENVISTKCIYCRNDVIVNKTKDKIAFPNKVIPFKISKNDAKKQFTEYMKNRKLLPDNFNVEKNIKEINGLYIPFWLYSNKYKVSIRGNEGLIKRASVELDYVPFDANKHLDNAITKGIEPYDYKDLCDFDSAYLSGFVAQKYDIDSEEGKKEIKRRCALTIENMFTSIKSKYYIKDATFVQETPEKEEIHYALLPLWILNIRYEKEDYMLIMNGQTGKVVGRLPIDKKKYITSGVLIFITGLLICILLLMIFRWGGIL